MRLYSSVIIYVILFSYEQCPISLYAGLSVGYEQAKNGGIIWQLLGDFKNKSQQGIPYVLGVGGRYDYMLSEYQ